MEPAVTLDSNSNKSPLAQRFRGFLPVIVDVETGGFNADGDALLEIAAVTLDMNDDGLLVRDQTFDFHIEPFEGANIEQSALDFTGIDLEDPERDAVPEDFALAELFREIRRTVKHHGCTRAVMVAHNAHFDLGFVNAAANRCDIKRNPFHPFSCFDTATLSGLAFGQTVLAKTCQAAGIDFSNSQAHTAAYDAEKTADLFCLIVNRWQALGGWPPPLD
ncbi:ribonuclease T [Pseudomaricurvus sp. HS19]|uniref:ribonuclease T n=1 Tax=Pseudomaricurvus sp. HS19 TaxID=2692626 RepID=UPI00136949B8|nr:ribonuclease T [Pseudomaricurvus sp. HS19]MYM63195.1 ribonuclease T [Pseudomaricurvus sp. HS19]